MSAPKFTIAVLGCGFLGSRIAAELALCCCNVRVFDRGLTSMDDLQACLRPVFDEVHSFFARNGGVTPAVAAALTDAKQRIVYCSSLDELALGADMVSEALPENLSLKQVWVSESVSCCLLQRLWQPPPRVRQLPPSPHPSSRRRH